MSDWLSTGLTALLCAVVIWVSLAGGGVVIDAVRRIVARRRANLGSVQRESVARATREQERRDCGCPEDEA